jgi:hypothetical protein
LRFYLTPNPSPKTPLVPLIRGKPFASLDKGRSGGVVFYEFAIFILLVIY